MESGLFIAGEADLEAALLVVRRAPRRAALLCDIDGTIAPIVARPADAAVPAGTRELLAALVRRLGLVAFVTGRGLDDGRRMIPLEGAVYVGTHGLERLDGDGTRLIEPDAEPYVAVIQKIAEAAARDLDVAAMGLVIENKRTVVAGRLPAGRRQGGRRASDPRRGRGARAGARPDHLHGSLRVRGPPTGASGQGHGDRPPPGRGRRIWRRCSVATTSPT